MGRPSRVVAGPAAPGARGGDPQPVAARPRPHHPQFGLPQAPVQDPGLRQPRGRFLSNTPDPQHRGGADRPLDRPRTRPRRGPDRGAGAGPRPRPPALRPCRRGRAAGRDEGVRRLRPQRPGAAHRDPARKPVCGVRRPEPHVGDAGGAGQAQRTAPPPAALRRRVQRAPQARPLHPCLGRGAGRGTRRRRRLPQPRPRRRATRAAVRDRGHPPPARGRRGAGRGPSFQPRHARGQAQARDHPPRHQCADHRSRDRRRGAVSPPSTPPTRMRSAARAGPWWRSAPRWPKPTA